MRIDIVTLFPEMFDGPFGCSIMKRAIDEKIIEVHKVNPRDFTQDKHRTVDDYPFGGGDGMVMKAEPVFAAVRSIKKFPNQRVLLMCPGGTPFTQKKAQELAVYDQLVLICGHYEGMDARIADHLVDESISIGDYVLTGGELPAMVIADAVARMLPGVLGSEESAKQDSFYNGLLEYPQYTRPRDFEGMAVPEVLVSGDHAKIARWRRKQSLKNTLLHRPDLLDKFVLNTEDERLLEEIEREIEE